MIPLSTPNLSGRESEYLQECVTSTFVSSVGPYVNQFEDGVSRLAGADFGVATSSGTTGLHVALVGVGVQSGDLVISPSFTFIATANAISHAGAVPWLIDIDAASWTIDPALVRHELETNCKVVQGRTVHIPSGRRVAAMLPVHVLGIPADIGTLCEIAREWKLPIVVDAAAALGATFADRPIADQPVALSVFSFNGNKTITCGGGGCVVGKDDRLMARVRHLTTTARNGPGYDHDEIGFNYRMTNLQAAVGCAQLENFTDYLAAKIRIKHRYDAAFAGSVYLPFPEPEGRTSACWLSGIVLPDPADADALRERMRHSGIEASSF